jgi:hypothetical protein
MKKLLILFMLAAVTLLFCCCYSEDTQIESNISEIRMNIFEGRGDFFDVSIYIGKRESPYNMDGISERLVDYCLIDVMPAEELDEGYALNFTLNGGKYNESGTLMEDPATGRFRADLGKYYSDISELNVTLSCGEIGESVIVSAKFNDNMIRWKDALSIAKDNLAESFQNAFVDKSFQGEIFIRFVNNPLMGEDKYFWFVMLRDRGGKMSTVLIDSLNSSVVAKNIT